MKNELDNLERALTSPPSLSSLTIKNYLISARIFLNFLGDRLPPSEADLRQFLTQQKEKGIAPQTQNYYLFVLQRLYEANSWNFPLSKEDRPVIFQESATIPFTRAEIRTLVENRENYSKEERFYLALATTLGMSRAELAKVEKKDVKERELRIRPVRHGAGRWALIPDEIAPIIHGYRLKKLNMDTLSVILRRILSKSDLEQTKGHRWHSIRIALFEGLRVALAQNNFPIILADIYLRFNKATIPNRYWAVEGARRYNGIEAIPDEPYALDKIILQVHPFTSFWQS